MSGFEQALARALDDLAHDRLADPDEYLTMVPAERRDEFVDRLTAAMAGRPPSTTAVPAHEAHERALAAVAAARSAGGPSGILPEALIALRRARGVERDDVLDTLAADLEIGPGGRPALRRYYHQLETGTLLGSRVSHRVLASLARRLGARLEDFVAASRPTGPAGAGRGALGGALARGAGDARAGGSASAGRAEPRPAAPDPDAERVARLFCGGPDA
jgi:hypothetical protein